MKRAVTLAVAILTALPCAMARAGDQPLPAAQKTPCLIDGKPADPDLLKAAMDLEMAGNSADHMSQIIDALVPSTIDMVRKTAPGVSDEAIAAFSEEFKKEMKAGIPQVLDQMACIVARHYTLSDMQQLEKFYATPLGQKMLQTMPEIAKEVFPIAQAWGMSTGMSAAQHAIEKLRAKGVKI